MKKVLYTLLGLIGLISLLCSITASRILSPSLMSDAFSRIPSQDKKNVLDTFQVSPGSYDQYANAITAFLDGQGDMVQVKNSEGETVPAFVDEENIQNIHMLQVRPVIQGLVLARYIGGGIVLAALCALWLYCSSKKKSFPGTAVFHGFATAGAILLLLFIAIAVWAAIDFYSLFIVMHKVLFPGSTAWLLDESKHLLLAMMPESFFVYYAKKLLIANLPIFGIMLLLQVARYKFKDEVAKKGTK